MLNKKLLTKLCAVGAAVYSLSNAPLFADYFSSYGKNSNSNEEQTTPTNSITVHEQNEEKEIFANGFTRGDLCYLYNGKFDPSQIENVTGDVENVLRVQCPDQDCYLIAIISTKTNNNKMAVNLGPVWFIEENKMAINEGDSLQITGAKMRTNGRYVLIATEVTKNGKTLNIRDKEGTPLWGSPKSQKGNAECMKYEKKPQKGEKSEKMTNYYSY